MQRRAPLPAGAPVEMARNLRIHPSKAPFGEWIQANIAAETWREWIDQGTKVINELRLDLSRDEDSAAYDKHMNEFLGVPEGLSGN